MNGIWRHIVSATVTICIVMSSAFVCAPAVAPVEGHCKPAAVMQAGCSHCHPKNVMDCCATSTPSPTVPQESQQQGTRLVPTTSPAQVDAAAVLASMPPAAAVRAFHAAPPHGYRSTDLPTLNAVFLI